MRGIFQFLGIATPTSAIFAVVVPGRGILRLCSEHHCCAVPAGFCVIKPDEADCLTMLNTLLFKAIVILILVMSCWDFLRKRVNTKVAEPEDKIAAANARERHQWRYARWGWNLIQLACCLYFIFSAIRFILS